MFAELVFLRPAWWWLALLAPALAWWVYRRRATGGGWLKVVSPSLQKYVLSGSGKSRQSLLLAALCALVVLLTALALSGPAWDKRVEDLRRGGDALVVALDLSRSMDVADLAPSRLARAKIKLLEILEEREGGQTALIVYSANAFTVVPLTDDTGTIAALVTSLSTDIMPSRGSYPAAAIRKAATLLEQAAVSNGRVLLIADGGYSSAAKEAAESLAVGGHRLSVLGVGTSAGGPVPSPGGGFEKDRDGKVAVVGLQSRDLARLAYAGQGEYVQITSDNSDINRLLGDAGTISASSVADGKSVSIWNDRGIFVVLLLLPLGALLFRRGWLFGVALFVVITPATPEAQTLSFEDLWRTPDQQGQKRMDEERYDEAANRFSDDRWRAAAHYRDGQFSASADALRDAADARDHYNRGNALARLGQYPEAISAYEEVLRLEPEHADALYNKSLIEEQQQKDESQSQQQQGGEGQQSGESGQNSEQQSEGSEQGGSESGETSDPQQAEGAENSEPSDGGPENAAAQQEGDEQAEVERLREAMRNQLAGEKEEPPRQDAGARELSAAERSDQEMQESMDQWLRRIQHDPGGLLRRKFHRQYRRLGRDQDGGNLWPDDEDEPW